MQRISSQEEDLAAGWHRSVPPGQWQLSRSAAAQVTSVTVRVEAACASSRQSWQMQVHAVITGARCKLNFLCILTREPGRLAVGKFDQLMSICSAETCSCCGGPVVKASDVQVEAGRQRQVVEKRVQTMEERL